MGSRAPAVRDTQDGDLDYYQLHLCGGFRGLL